MAEKKSIFRFGDMFGYNSPFQRDWVTEMREEREERERKKQLLQSQSQNKHNLPDGGIHFVLNGVDIAVKNKAGYHYSKEIKEGQLSAAKYFMTSYKKAEEYLRKSKKAAEVLDYLEKQVQDIRIHYSEDISGSYAGMDIGTAWNPFLWSIVDDYGINSPAIILIHELYHQYNDLVFSDEIDEINHITLFEKNRKKERKDTFGVEEEYLTTMFVNAVIKEGSLADKLRKTYTNFGFFRIWGTFKAKIVTSTYDTIRDRSVSLRAYYLLEGFISLSGSNILFLFEDDDLAMQNKGGVSIPISYTRKGI